jgi:hypothetical protein
MSPMDKKLRTFLIVGVIQLALLLVIRASAPTMLSVSGNYVTKLGNRTISVKTPSGYVLETNAATIRTRTNVDLPLAFALLGDSSAPSRPPLLVDYLEAGDLDHLDSVRTLLLKDTSGVLIHQRLLKDHLTLIHRMTEPNWGSHYYILQRYVLCYPYYLRARTFWTGDSTIPMDVANGLAAIEVRR